MTGALDEALMPIPDGLRKPLISEFEHLLSEYRAADWEKVGLKAGKICETVYTILQGHTSGSFAPTPSKPSNMVAACTALEGAGAQFSRPIRIQIPRVLMALYELRNNRAIGHLSGDLDPNHMDAEFFLRGCKWMISELVRVFTDLKPDDARELIEQVTERILPVIWESAEGKKVLNPNLSTRNKTLVLAYSTPGGVTASQLQAWIGYGNLSRFRTQILKSLDSEALIKFDRESDKVTISPTGIRLVENSRLLELR